MDKKHVPDQEGTPPLFHGEIGLAWDADDPKHSWLAQIQRGGSDAPWLPMPLLVGNQPLALQGVTAIRLVQTDSELSAWRVRHLGADAQAYQESGNGAGARAAGPMSSGGILS